MIRWKTRAFLEFHKIRADIGVKKAALFYCSLSEEKPPVMLVDRSLKWLPVK